MTNFEKYRAAFSVHAPEGALQRAMESASKTASDKTENINRERHRLVLLPAILAAAVLMGAVGTPTVYKLLSGMEVRQNKSRFSVDFSAENPPASVEDGRLWFTADGQHTDITDLTDEDTPYIYTSANPATRAPVYIIVGGTPNGFGYAEIWINQDTVGFAARRGDASTEMELTARQFRQGLWEVPVQSIGGSWLLAAVRQLEPELAQYLPEE